MHCHTRKKSVWSVTGKATYPPHPAIVILRFTTKFSPSAFTRFRTHILNCPRNTWEFAIYLLSPPPSLHVPSCFAAWDIKKTSQPLPSLRPHYSVYMKNIIPVKCVAPAVVPNQANWKIKNELDSRISNLKSRANEPKSTHRKKKKKQTQEEQAVQNPPPPETPSAPIFYHHNYYCI